MAVRKFVHVFFGLFLTAAVAVGLPAPALAAAGDGTSWTAQSGIPTGAWTSVAYGDGMFVAVGTTGAFVMTSPDGVTWTARTAAENNYWQHVTYGNGTFVAVASTGTNRVMTSSDGITWTAHAATASVTWWDVAYGNGVFVAVGNSGNVMTSPDGATWTAQTSAVPSLDWHTVEFGNSTFVAISPTSGSQSIMTSPDGVSWTRQTMTDAAQWLGLAYGNGTFVARTYLGGLIATSPDGVTWTRRASGAGNAGVFFGNSTFVSFPTGSVQTSTNDGVTWASSAAPPATATSATFAEGLFAAVGTNTVMTSGTYSPQQVTWSPSNTAATTSDSPLTPDSTATRTPSDGGSISYSVANAGTTGCTVNSSTGVLTYSSAGTCQVTATAAQTSAYSEASTTVSFTISAPAASTPAPASGGSSSSSSSDSGGGGALQTITEVRPASGPLAGGNTVALVGYGFTGATAVTIGGKEASFQVINDAHVDVVIPPGSALGSADVAVVLTPERGRAFAPGGYVYTPNPTTATPAAPPASAPDATVLSATGAIANPSKTRVLPRGITLLSEEDAATAKKELLKAPVKKRLRASPAVTLKKNIAASYTVRGLPPETRVIAQIRIGKKYFNIGRGTTTSTGRLRLPAFLGAKKGSFPMRFKPATGAKTYLKLNVT